MLNKVVAIARSCDAWFMAEASKVSLFGLTDRSLNWTILIGGVVLALLAFAASIRFGNPLGLLMDGAGAFIFFGVFLLALMSLAGRRLFDAARRRAGLPEAGYGRVTAIKVICHLILLVATTLAGVVWLLALAIGANLQTAALQALLLVLVGGVAVTMALSTIAHIAETVAAVRPPSSPQPPAAP